MNERDIAALILLFTTVNVVVFTAIATASVIVTLLDYRDTNDTYRFVVNNQMDLNFRTIAAMHCRTARIRLVLSILACILGLVAGLAVWIVSPATGLLATVVLNVWA